MTRGVGGHSPANVQKFLAGMHYPASKRDLIACARSNQAPPEVLDELEHLTTDDFGGPQDVMKAYGQDRASNKSQPNKAQSNMSHRREDPPTTRH